MKIVLGSISVGSATLQQVSVAFHKYDTDVTMDNCYYYFSVTDKARQEYKVVKVSPEAHWDPAMPGH